MSTIPTTAQLETMTIRELTVFWNDHCAVLDRPQIKKFTDKTQGLKRCGDLSDFLRKQQKAQPAVKVTRRTISLVARQLILEGYDNKAVFQYLTDEFKIGENKKHYPAWYRSEMRRKGLLKD